MCPADSNSLDMFVIADTVKHNLYRGNSRHTLMKKQQDPCRYPGLLFYIQQRALVSHLQEPRNRLHASQHPEKYRNSIPLP